MVKWNLNIIFILLDLLYTTGTTDTTSIGKNY